MKQYIFIFLLFISLIFIKFNLTSVLAIECDGNMPTNDPDLLNQYIDSCQQKINDSQAQQQTLSSAIAYLDNQINLTSAKIAKTTQDLTTLNAEIEDLSTKIESLDYSLDDLTKLFVARVKSDYKHQPRHNTLLSLFQTSGFFDFFRHYQYIIRVRDHDRQLLIELESARLNYDKQKALKEEKQAEVVQLQTKLNSQQATLTTQVQAKNKLLADTKNDEQKYAQLLSQAKAQLLAFQRFVTDQGGSSILNNQTQCNNWGCYYNQRDSQWGNHIMGASDSLMRDYGCLVTSMAMIASHYGKSLNPLDIASSLNPFWGTTAYMLQGSWTVNGVTMTRTRLGSSRSYIDSELEQGRPVIVGIYSGPEHFLVIKAKQGNDYLIHDPFPANSADVLFTERYPLSVITTVDRVTVN